MSRLDVIKLINLQETRDYKATLFRCVVWGANAEVDRRHERHVEHKLNISLMASITTQSSSLSPIFTFPLWSTGVMRYLDEQFLVARRKPFWADKNVRTAVVSGPNVTKTLLKRSQNLH